MNNDKLEPGVLILPSLVPVEKKLILSPDVERERALRAIEEETAAYEEEHLVDDSPTVELRDRVKHGVCRKCGHRKLLFKPAMLCEKDLRQAAEDEGLTMPPPIQHRPKNRAERRAKGKRHGS